jgi:hypothetical protein
MMIYVSTNEHWRGFKEHDGYARGGRRAVVTVSWATMFDFKQGHLATKVCLFPPAFPTEATPNLKTHVPANTVCFEGNSPHLRANFTILHSHSSPFQNCTNQKWAAKKGEMEKHDGF